MTTASPVLSSRIAHGHARVGIVGAGLAGLAVARELEAAGCTVRLFDKSRGVGGRMATRRAHDTTFDHGAQYFTVRDPRFERQVRCLKQAGVVEAWRGRLVTLRDGEVGAVRGDETRYVGVPTMSAVGRSLARGLDVHLGHRVCAVDRDADGWRIHFDLEQQQLSARSAASVKTADASQRYDALVLALPASQALGLLDDNSALRGPIVSVTLQPCWSAMLVFDEAYDVGFDGAFVSGGALSWIARNASKPGRQGGDAWVLHATPEWSTEHLEDDPESVVATLAEELAAAAGFTLPTIEYGTAHRWRYAIADRPLERGCLWSAEEALGVCGDWCHGSRVEGAFLSGLALAAAMQGGEAGG
jgi:renalase